MMITVKDLNEKNAVSAIKKVFLWAKRKKEFEKEREEIFKRNRELLEEALKKES